MKSFVPVIDRYRIEVTPRTTFYIECRLQRDGSEKWIIQDDARFVLNNQDKWEAEPMLNSSKSDEFLARTRFNYGEALMRAQKEAQSIFLEYEERKAKNALNT